MVHSRQQTVEHTYSDVGNSSSVEDGNNLHRAAAKLKKKSSGGTAEQPAKHLRGQQVGTVLSPAEFTHTMRQRGLCDYAFDEKKEQRAA